MKIQGRNVNTTFTEALWAMKVENKIEGSRAGRVRTAQEPVLITHDKPRERVLFCEERMENPIFHFMECLWMMAGRQDSKWLEQFNPRMAEFAEKDGILHGAYGWRWRHHFGIDQIKEVVRMLLADRTTRRAVIQMWNPLDDLNIEKKDLPCNTHIYFRSYGKKLDMTVCNRSNDLVWGALGSNVVHFSFLHELIAHASGMFTGAMHQFTNNLHIYERHWHFLDIPPACEQYEDLDVQPYPIVKGSLSSWLRECGEFVDGKAAGFTEPFFSEVAIPMFSGELHKIKATDWRLACERYKERKKRAPTP